MSSTLPKAYIVQHAVDKKKMNVICLLATLVNSNNAFVTNKMENAVSHFLRMNNYIKKPTYGGEKNPATLPWM